MIFWRLSNPTKNWVLLLFFSTFWFPPDFRVLSFCSISIAFDFKVHLVGLYSANVFLPHEFFVPLIQHLRSSDFGLLSFCQISIKFGMKVHLVGLNGKNDFTLNFGSWKVESSAKIPKDLKSILMLGCPRDFLCSFSVCTVANTSDEWFIFIYNMNIFIFII